MDRLPSTEHSHHITRRQALAGMQDDTWRRLLSRSQHGHGIAHVLDPHLWRRQVARARDRGQGRFGNTHEGTGDIASYTVYRRGAVTHCIRSQRQHDFLSERLRHGVGAERMGLLAFVQYPYASLNSRGTDVHESRAVGNNGGKQSRQQRVRPKESVSMTGRRRYPGSVYNHIAALEGFREGMGFRKSPVRRDLGHYPLHPPCRRTQARWTHAQHVRTASLERGLHLRTDEPSGPNQRHGAHGPCISIASINTCSSRRAPASAESSRA